MVEIRVCWAVFDRRRYIRGVFVEKAITSSFEVSQLVQSIYVSTKFSKFSQDIL